MGAIVIAASLAVPLTSLILDHKRQRKGDIVDEKFAAALDEIPDPEKRIQAIITYRQTTSPATVPQPPPEPPPGAIPPADPTGAGQIPAST
ncbi:hypothetical protein ACIPPJ_35395 [Streptomyces sp. NPDC086091]|uniref:hypothetical protein n=1 Tax=Streptomyces sp. NPDC086091 TaxID=3365751 RepID=UPI003806B7D3